MNESHLTIVDGYFYRLVIVLTDQIKSLYQLNNK